MATRSTIAVQHANGSVSQVYCHWDGYLEHNGRILQESFNSYERAEALVALGSISSLENDIESTVFYGRDRNEDDTEPQVFANWSKFEKEMQHEEYDYVFRNGKWFVMQYEREWEELEAVITELKD